MNKGDRVIIVHGTEGSPAINWFPWLREELAQRGVESVSPQFPTPEGQSLKSWLTTFKDQVGDVSSRDFLVGHSTGVIFLLNVLNRIHETVKGTFLVGGFVRPNGSPKYDNLNSSFLATKLDWETVKQNAGSVFVYSGDNDPYVPLENGEELAKLLAVKLRVIPGGGHLNGESGYLSFGELLREMETI